MPRPRMPRPRSIVCAAAVALCAGLTSPDPVSAQIPLGFRTANGQSVTPVFEGWYQNPDGTFSLSFGYFNRNFEEVVEIPVGAGNRLEPADFDGPQPTQFSPRRHWGVFTVTVPADFGDKAVVWTIDFRGERYSIPGTLHTGLGDRCARGRGGIRQHATRSCLLRGRSGRSRPGWTLERTGRGDGGDSRAADRVGPRRWQGPSGEAHRCQCGLDVVQTSGTRRRHVQ